MAEHFPAMPLGVTFDTGALNDVVWPGASQPPTDPADAARVRAAILSGQIQGVFCETLITLEGIKRVDRSVVLGSTVANASYQHEIASDGSGVTHIDLHVEQSARRTLDQQQVDRFLGAFDLRMKLLAVLPRRIGMAGVDDPDGSRYMILSEEAELVQCMERQHALRSAIEARDLGCAQARRIAREIQQEIGGHGNFLFYLGRPRKPTEQKKIIPAIAEWSDGDSIAAHHGYGIELFCSRDCGKNAGKASVLHPDNRRWLTETFGIQFVTLADLAKRVAAQGRRL